MDKCRMTSRDLVQDNIEAIGKLFPNCIKEVRNADGALEHQIDFDALKQELSRSVIEGRPERYEFNWPGKRAAALLANTPIQATLRPCREESVNFDTTENLYIEGDNLDVLKLLCDNYRGKIKMIYIDPPYNTGNDFVYEDDFAQTGEEYRSISGDYDDQGNRLTKNTTASGRFHTDWLNMMYPRLKIAQKLLRDDGVIAISIGCDEVHNLMKLCQDLFGNKQVFAVTVQTSGGKPNGSFNISNEYVVFIIPNDFLPIPTEEDMKEYASPYHGMNLATFNQIQRPNQAYPIFVNKDGVLIKCGKTLQERIDSGEYQGEKSDFVYDYSEATDGLFAIWPITAKGDQCVWRLIPSRLMDDWKKGYIKIIRQKESANKNQFSIQYLSAGVIDKIQNGELATEPESSNPDIPTLRIKDYKTAGSGIASIWSDSNFYTINGNNDIKDLFGTRVFSYPKPIALLQYILKRITKDNDIVLDFFSGSATMAHATMKLNSDKKARKFIMVQLPEKLDDDTPIGKNAIAFCRQQKVDENICSIAKERIRRAGAKIAADNALTVPNLDIGFRVLKLDSSNMADVYYSPDKLKQEDLLFQADNVKPDRSSEDLLFQVMLEKDIPLSSRIETENVAGMTIFNVADGYLLACFDSGVTDEVVTAIAKKKPVHAVFRDAGMASDSTAINFEQIFATYSPDTKRAII